MKGCRLNVRWGFRPLVLVIGLLFLILQGCGSSGGNPEPPPPPDLSGAWAGTWDGVDSIFGQVSGRWEAEADQSDSGVSGTFFLFGDVDCAEGTLSGSLDTNNIPTGTLLRPPCPHNEWVLSAIDLNGRNASGTWTKPATGGGGAFSGTQVAVPGGPRIRFFTPPGATAGGLVTLVGDGFSTTTTANSLTLNGVPVTVEEILNNQTLTARLASGLRNGKFELTTASGTAISPLPFIADVSSPQLLVRGSVSVGTPQEGVAVSPDGVRGYLAINDSGTPEHAVAMFDISSNQTLLSTTLSRTNLVHGLVISPDGRRLYAANGAEGVKVLHGVTLAEVDSFPVSAGGNDLSNPQGIAVSPDGRLLFVSSRVADGAVSILDLETRQVVDEIHGTSGSLPGGLAPDPDGHKLYLTFSSPGGTGNLVVYDLDIGAVLETLDLGQDPLGIAVTPDGSRVFVGNSGDATVTVIDTEIYQPVATLPITGNPSGLLVSPDGEVLLVLSQSSDRLERFSTSTYQQLGSLVLAAGPMALATPPDGKRAYASHGGSSTVSEIGGIATLTITRGGDGFGTVTSAPTGISCGSNCQVSLPIGTHVTLMVSSNDTSAFTGWSGDADCLDGEVFLDANTSCFASFTYIPPIGCFIATAAYGSYLEPEVEVLKQFRDQVLLSTSLGKGLVDFYYHYSPPLAEVIARHESLRFATRIVLTPLVYGLKFPLVTGILVLILGSGIWWKGRRRRKVK